MLDRIGNTHLDFCKAPLIGSRTEALYFRLLPPPPPPPPPNRNDVVVVVVVVVVAVVVVAGAVLVAAVAAGAALVVVADGVKVGAAAVRSTQIYEYVCLCTICNRPSS